MASRKCSRISSSMLGTKGERIFRVQACGVLESRPGGN